MIMVRVIINNLKKFIDQAKNFMLEGECRARDATARRCGLARRTKARTEPRGAFVMRTAVISPPHLAHYTISLAHRKLAGVELIRANARLAIISCVAGLSVCSFEIDAFGNMLVVVGAVWCAVRLAPRLCDAMSRLNMQVENQASSAINILFASEAYHSNYARDNLSPNCRLPASKQSLTIILSHSITFILLEKVALKLQSCAWVCVCLVTRFSPAPPDWFLWLFSIY
jgi:hypothetical protein